MRTSYLTLIAAAILVLSLILLQSCAGNDGDDDDDDDNDEDDAGDDDAGDDDAGDDDAGDDDDALDYQALPLTTCLVDEEGAEFVIRTQEEWDEFAGNIFTDDPGVEINFDEQMVAGIITGAGGCVIFGEIVMIQQTEEALVFHYAVSGDGPCFCDLRLPIFAILDQSDLPVEFVRVEKGAPKEDASYTPLFVFNCNIFEEGEFVIRTQEEWESFLGYRRAASEVTIDFDERMVLGAVGGAGGCVGLGRIVDLVVGDESVLFQYDLSGDGLCECWLLVSIFSIVAQNDLPVEFVGPET